MLLGEDRDKSGPVLCELMGTVKRQNNGRVQQMMVDPSGAYLAVLVSNGEREREDCKRNVLRRALLAKSGEVCLEVFRLRGRDEMERLVRKKLRKARRRLQRWYALLLVVMTYM